MAIMALREWIVESGKAATVTLATTATLEGLGGGTVARVATVAVASPQNAKGEGVDLTALLAEACQGVPGIDAATYRALLTREDIEDIEGGFIPMVTLRAYAESMSRHLDDVPIVHQRQPTN